MYLLYLEVFAIFQGLCYISRSLQYSGYILGLGLSTLLVFQLQTRFFKFSSKKIELTRQTNQGISNVRSSQAQLQEYLWSNSQIQTLAVDACSYNSLRKHTYAHTLWLLELQKVQKLSSFQLKYKTLDYLCNSQIKHLIICTVDSFH